MFSDIVKLGLSCVVTGVGIVVGLWAGEKAVRVLNAAPETIYDGVSSVVSKLKGGKKSDGEAEPSRAANGRHVPVSA